MLVLVTDKTTVNPLLPCGAQYLHHIMSTRRLRRQGLGLDPPAPASRGRNRGSSSVPAEPEGEAGRFSPRLREVRQTLGRLGTLVRLNTRGEVSREESPGVLRGGRVRAAAAGQETSPQSSREEVAREAAPVVRARGRCTGRRGGGRGGGGRPVPTFQDDQMPVPVPVLQVMVAILFVKQNFLNSLTFLTDLLFTILYTILFIIILFTNCNY